MLYCIYTQYYTKNYTGYNIIYVCVCVCACVRVCVCVCVYV